VAINDSRHYAAEVLAAILGGGMSSRLFRRIRDELGAAYYVRATNNAYTDHGVLEIAVGADNRRVLEVVQVALEECTKLCHKLVPSSELDRIKQSLAGQLLLGLETTAHLASFYAEGEILEGKLTSPEQIIKKIRAVTAAEIRELARALFTNEHLNLALVGPAIDQATIVGALTL
jgi:predicted Zn-dependent peptidase